MNPARGKSFEELLNSGAEIQATIRVAAMQGN
jgi:hypothetical protein